MKKSHINAAPHTRQDKDSKYFSENKLFAVRKAFKECPKTMREVSRELNEERSNICYYVGMLRDADQVQVHHRGECITTKHIVNYYTCDPDLFTVDNKQFNLFDDGEE